MGCICTACPEASACHTTRPEQLTVIHKTSPATRVFEQVPYSMQKDYSFNFKQAGSWSMTRPMQGNARYSCDPAQSMNTNLSMSEFLSLPDEVIELVGRYIIDDWWGDGLRKWCHLTTTCKRLWHMQLPESSREWLVDVDNGMRGESELPLVQLNEQEIYQRSNQHPAT